MSCVFGSSFDQARVSRECVGIDQWMDGINPGQCFSQVTLDIQTIGVSLQQAGACIYGQLVLNGLFYFNNNHVFTLQTINITTNNTVNTVSALSQLIDDAEPTDQLQVNFVVVVQVFETVAAMALVQNGLTVEDERQV